MTELNDQILLSRYLRGADDAFRQLLDRHAGLVFGTAMRVTGDRGAAEEVSQDVFVLLARKARRLLSHPSVAGWLHRTSHHVAQHARRKRIRQEKKVAHLALESIPVADSPAKNSLSGIDEAISRLPKLDREAILLRFFEDLDYVEIAQRLALSQPATRKRVSRALSRLHDLLGAERASAAASGALVMAAPLALAAQIAPVVPAAGSLGTTAAIANLVTTMTTNTALKVSCVAIAGGVLLFTSIHQTRKSRALAGELAAAQDQIQELRAKSGPRGSKSAAGPESAATPDRDATGGDAASLDGKVAALTAQLDAERRMRAAAEQKVASLQAELAPLNEEVVVAFGKIEEIGRDFGSLVTEARFLADMEAADRLGEEDIKKRLARFYQSAASMGGLSQQIVEMEGDPVEGAEFFSATYAQLFGLEDAERAMLRDIFARHIEESVKRELSLAQITSVLDADVEGGFEAEIERRMGQRQEYFRTVRAELRDVIPEERQGDFDTWVERDGIGFNNLTLRGTPLHFSLGGNQSGKDGEKAKAGNDATPE